MAALLVDPELGAARDWDLLSLFGFPLSILGGVWLVRTVEDKRGRAALAFAAAVLVMVQIVPNLAEKTSLEVATARLDNLLWDDPHYQVNHDEAARSLAWGFVLDSDVGDPARARRYFKRRLQAKSTSHQAWVNLGDIYYREGIYDSAAVCFRNAVKCSYTEPHMLNRLANAEMQCGRKEVALKYIGMAAEKLPDDVGIQTTYGVSLFTTGHQEEALAPLRRAYALKPDGADQAFNLGLYFYSTGISDSAYHYFDRGLSMVTPSREHSVYYGMYIESAINLGKRHEAARALATLERINPQGDIGRYREMLAATQ
jgi:tetratricopeptide (TPR) repeat protein